MGNSSHGKSLPQNDFEPENTHDYFPVSNMNKTLKSFNDEVEVTLPNAKCIFVIKGEKHRDLSKYTSS